MDNLALTCQLRMYSSKYAIPVPGNSRAICGITAERAGLQPSGSQLSSLGALDCRLEASSRVVRGDERAEGHPVR